VLDKSSLSNQSLSAPAKPVLVAIVSIVLAGCFFSGQASEVRELSRVDMENPDRIISYRKDISSTSLEASNSLYEDAVTHKDPGSSVKYLYESIATYPTSRAFSKLVEYRLKQLHYKEHEIKLRTLNKSLKYAQVALKLNEIDSFLSEQQTSQLISNRSCIQQYLETKIANPKCEALLWIDIK